MTVKDLSHHLSNEAKRRNASALKTAFKYFGKDDIVFLGGGLPLSDYFPWDKITATSPAPPFAKGIGAKPTNESDTVITEVGKTTDLEFDIPLARSLQYGHTEGQPELLHFIREHTELIHKIPNSEWDVIITVGNTQSWEASLRTFCNPGDFIVVEEYTFPSAIETARALSVNFAPVEMDDQGIIPEKLDQLFTEWDPAKPKPKLLYTIGTGQNPTGSSLPNERRKAIYEIACKHDFIIVEDEPYYFLQMDEYKKNAGEPAAVTHEEFLAALVKSFSSMDVEGRVVRLDSFSKVLAPGARLGWIVAQKPLLERFVRLHEVTIQTASGFTQTLVSGLLGRWGQKGYLDWLIGLRKEYTIKRNFTIDSLSKHMPSVVKFEPPFAGMFFIVKIDAAKHPKFATEFGKDPLKVEAAIYEKSLEQGCLMIPGSWFKSPNFKDHGSSEIFFRGTYAAVALEKLDVGLERFGKAVELEFSS
ncbi:hypothetical protein KL921_001083 [Ogataea angusta]|uniref:aromatic-amino-acid transaminase n=1 Tax=Pichia angusta TaxID=870730 RepID=A0AAN6DHT3_PICAN|nr:uncharacterized protein KL928_001250 [Ogataea angusta]KAG7813537.1 hypothetical protein KL921_001083 [Ogataea angusta]KAG7821166.1 hypothetical protein KL928_001250 [Ogataea angusta]KAG7826132.1 hypothetical protein KL909_000184 [Ogataea angusta]KAG7832121.1 hypothetical protein KL920_000456 [Ogataea angusta]KAG7836294.1 hypothetical protein KL943_001943 [Ogataea angusta]